MKRLFSFFMAVLIVFGSSGIYAREKTPDIFNLNCKSALLMEYSTGKVIYENNSHARLLPASVTKVMTMLLAMEAVDSGQAKLSDKVIASPRAKSMGGSTMYLETGEVRTVEELIKGVSVESANDAAVALAEHFGGTEEGFVIKMNERAKQLGMKDTNFTNCTGFYTENHYTSAYDIAIMSKELLKHKKILDYTSIWMETISEGRMKPFTLVNRNKMIKAYSGCDGLKTGYIPESKYCISSTAKRGDIRFIAVIMGAPSWKERNEQAGKLLDYGFSKYESVKIVNRGEGLGEIAIPRSMPDKAKVFAKDDLNVIFEKGSRMKLEKKIEMFENIKLPVKKGDAVGIVKAVEGDKVYGQTDIVIEQDIRKMNFGDTLGKTFKYWLNIK